MPLLSLACLLGLSAPGSTDIGIVVDPGPFASVREAALGEHQVGWIDGDYSDDNACTHAYAALELQRYLRRLSGRFDDFRFSENEALLGDLIEFFPEHDEDLDPDGFRISTDENRKRRVMTIVGGSRVGVLYGAYRVLHELGVRWYAPGRENEEVPRIRIDRLPIINITDAPAFRTRGFWAWEDRGNADFLDWMARNGMNLWTDAELNHPALKKRGIKLTCGGHQHIHRFLSPHAEYPYNHPLFDGDEAKPNDPYTAPPDFPGDTSGDGKLTYFEAHPEWYGLRGGKRSSKIQREFGDNYCTSNADATKELTSKLVEDLVSGTWRDADTINFWTLDAGKWCECEPCKTVGTRTDRNLALVHALRQEMLGARSEGRLNRDVLIMFLAYSDVVEPPTKPLPDDFDYDGCIATFFPIARCYVHTIDDPTCTEYNTRYRGHHQGWAVDPDRYYKGQIFIGEYYNVSGYKCLPICFKSAMQSDIPYYYQTGARHMHYMHCTTGNWGNKALTNWQMAQTLWDPQLNPDKLYRDYFDGRYGPASDAMRRYYDSLETMLCNVTELKYGVARRVNSGAENPFTRKHMRYEASSPEDSDGPDFVEMLAAADQCAKILDRVEAGDLPGDVAGRVAEDRKLFEYGHNTLRYLDSAIAAESSLREGDEATARVHYAETAQWQQLLLDDVTSTSMSSSHASAKNGYVATYATAAWSRLVGALGPVDPAEIREMGKAGIRFTGRDFGGGGAPLHGYNVTCGGLVDIKDANYVYSKKTGSPGTMQALFTCAKAPSEPMTLTMGGLTCPVRGQTEVKIGVYLNEQPIFEGVAPYEECVLGSASWDVSPALFVDGTNRIRITNLEEDGPVSNRPWFGMESVELAAYEKTPET